MLITIKFILDVYDLVKREIEDAENYPLKLVLLIGFWAVISVLLILFIMSFFFNLKVAITLLVIFAIIELVPVVKRASQRPPY